MKIHRMLTGRQKRVVASRREFVSAVSLFVYNLLIYLRYSDAPGLQRNGEMSQDIVSRQYFGFLRGGTVRGQGATRVFVPARQEFKVYLALAW